MDTKYYTPDIEDLHLGYIAEYFEPHSPNKWEQFRVDWLTIEDFASASEEFKKNNIRTKYLTKEDIESEGWQIENDISPFTGRQYKFTLDKTTDFPNEAVIYTLTWHERATPNIIISKFFHSSWSREDKVIYEGKCPSINEFKIITKLLGI